MFVAERPVIEKCKCTVKCQFFSMAAAIVATEAAGLFAFLWIQASLVMQIFCRLIFYYQGKKLLFLMAQIPWMGGAWILLRKIVYRPISWSYVRALEAKSIEKGLIYTSYVHTTSLKQTIMVLQTLSEINWNTPRSYHTSLYNAGSYPDPVLSIQIK